MKIAPIIPLVFALSMILARSQENPRSVDWVSKDGRSIQAHFLGLSDDFVALDRGGDPTAVAIGRLSPASRKLALEMARRQTPGQQVLAF